MKGIAVKIKDDSESRLLLDALYKFLHPILDEIDPLYWCFDEDIQPGIGFINDNWFWGDDNEEDDTSDGVFFEYLVDQEKLKISLAVSNRIQPPNMNLKKTLNESSFIGADIFDIYRPHMMKTFGFALNGYGYGGPHFYCGFPAETDEEAFIKINEICTDGDKLDVQYIFNISKIMEYKAIFACQVYDVYRIFAEEKYLDQLKRHYVCEEIDSDNPLDISGWTNTVLHFTFICES